MGREDQFESFTGIVPGEIYVGRRSSEVVICLALELDTLSAAVQP